MRQKKREVKIGNVTIGGSNPIAVQTMLNVPVEDIEGNVAQAKRCEAAGCQILRVTCPSPADAKCIEAVKNAVNIPIVADIHFDYKAALACADVGVDKIRINPGNIGDDDRVKAVVDACQQKNIPIRIGVNGGSLEKHILARYGAPTPEAMVESALYHVRLLEKFDFNNIVISIKNSNVPRMMEAYRQLSAVTDYPLHVGVTEAGTYQMGLLKSGMGIGGMLLEGIGDTIRVSLAAEPEKRGRGRLQHPARRGLPGHRAGGHHLSHLRTHSVPLHRDRQRGGKAAAGLQKVHQGGRDGLRCQRPRRGARSRYRYCRRQGRGCAVHPWQAHQKADRR